MTTRWNPLLLALIFVTLGACGGGGGGGGGDSGGGASSSPPPTNNPPPQSAAPSVTSFSASSVAAGSQVTLNGTGLDQVRLVGFYDTTLFVYNGSSTSSNNFSLPSGQAQSIDVVPLSQSATALTVTVPETADGGSLALADANGGILAYTPSLTVVKPVVVDWVRTRPTATGLTIYVQGAQLDKIISATIGGVAATITAQSLTALQLTIPGPVGNSTPIVLTPSNQLPVNAGLTGVIASGLTINSLEFAQVHDQQSTDAYLRLTPGRAVMVRAFVTADSAQIPTAILTASANGTVLGTVPMSPTSLTIPTNAAVYDGGVLGTAFDAAYDPPEGISPNAFFAILPPDWVKAGLTVRVAVTPDPKVSPGTSSIIQSATPTLGQATALNLVVVPLQISGVAPVLPAVSQIQQTIAAAYPYTVDNVHVSVHAAVSVPTNTAAQPLSDLSPLLSFVESLRKSEGSNQVYAGIYASSALAPDAQFVGLAYRNTTIQPASAWQTSLVAYDQPNTTPRDANPFGFFQSDWQVTLVHELGHNHTRSHTGCYNTGNKPPAGINFDYPYDASGGSTGAVGFQPLYLALSNDTSVGLFYGPYAPGTSAMTDVMGYCQFSGDTFFSTYNYYGVTLFAEQHQQSFPAATSIGRLTAKTEARSPEGYLTLSGTIEADGVEFEPAVAHAVSASQEVQGRPSVYHLIVRTVAGRLLDEPVFPAELADSSVHSSHFALTLANPGPIASVQLLYRGGQLEDRTPSARMGGSATTPAGNLVQYSVVDGTVELHWDSQVHPFLSVTRVDTQGRRTLLAHHLTGGTGRVDVTAIAAGADLEVSLASAYTARLVRISHAALLRQ